MLFEETIEIPFSKNKLGLFVAFAVALGAFGIWLLIDPDLIHLALAGIVPINNYFLGLLLISLACWITFVSVRRMRSVVPAIILDKEGLVEHVTQSSVKEVKWKDVVDISRAKVYNNIFIIIHIKDPEAYIEQQSNAMRRRLLKANNKTYGSPLAFSCAHLQYGSDDVYNMIDTYLQRSKS